MFCDIIPRMSGRMSSTASLLLFARRLRRTNGSIQTQTNDTRTTTRVMSCDTAKTLVTSPATTVTTML